VNRIGTICLAQSIAMPFSVLNSYIKCLQVNNTTHRELKFELLQFEEVMYCEWNDQWHGKED
jgi:hypothetical protein